MNLKEVKAVKLKITEMVNKTDPWQLIEMGAPDDEYNSYINRIVSFVINKKPDVNDLEAELLKIFRANEFELEKSSIKKLVENIKKLCH